VSVLPLTDDPDGCSFAVRVVPRAGRTEIAGTRGDALLIRIAAAPVDGAANDTLIALLAATFGLSKRHVSIVSGTTSRNKRVRIAGLTSARADASLSAILRSSASAKTFRRDRP
jgi:uncharacterized protein (TIGR00251 family)